MTIIIEETKKDLEFKLKDLEFCQQTALKYFIKNEGLLEYYVKEISIVKQLLKELDM